MIAVDGVLPKYEKWTRFKYRGHSGSSFNLGNFLFGGMERILLRIDKFNKFQASVHFLRDSHASMGFDPNTMVLAIKAVEGVWVDFAKQAYIRDHGGNGDEPAKLWHKFFRQTLQLFFTSQVP